MFHVKFVGITVQASTMEFMLAMDVRDFLNDQFVATVNMYANQNRTDFVWLTRLIAINVVRAD
jgi:hypothetical protein